MEPNIIQWVTLAITAVIIPAGVGGWRWARRTDRKVADNSQRFAVIDEKLNHIVEGLEAQDEHLTKHDEHLEELLTKVASELGSNGLSLRDRVTKAETQLSDHLHDHDHNHK